MKTTGDQPHALTQFRYHQQRRRCFANRQHARMGWFPNHRQRSRRAHRIDEFQAMPVPAAHREKQIARPNRATVARQPGNRPIGQMRRHLGKIRQQRAQGRPRRASHGFFSIAGVTPAIFMLGKSSGVTFRIRSTSPMVLPNTGAATVPP